MTDEVVETFLLVATQTPEIPTAYICKGKRSEVVKTACHKHFWINIFSLKAAGSQTPNPWSATIIRHEHVNHPEDAFVEAIKYARLHLLDFPKEQRENLIALAKAILEENEEKLTPLS